MNSDKETRDFVSGEIITLGEVMVEFFPVEPDVSLVEADTYTRGCAGAAPVYAAAITALGHRCSLVGSVGSDDFGLFAERTLKIAGVNTAGVKRQPSSHTSLAFTAYDREGNRSYVRAHSAGRAFSPKDINPDHFKHCKILHIPGTTLWISGSSAEAARCAADVVKSNGGSVFLDLNIRPQMMVPEKAITLAGEFFPLVDIIKVSEDEAGAILKTDFSVNKINELLKIGVSTVVVTMGGEGCVAADTSGKIHRVPGFPVEQVDPTGAGDVFFAGFTVALLEGKTLDEAAEFANAAGALTVCAVGHINRAIPRRGEVEDFLRDRRL